MRYLLIVAALASCGHGAEDPKPSRGSAAGDPAPPAPPPAPAKPAPPAAAPPDKTVGGCDAIAIDGLCDEFFGTQTTEAVQAICAKAKTKFVAHCPKDQALGRCAFHIGQPDEKHRLFYPPHNTADFLKAMCHAPSQILPP